MHIMLQIANIILESSYIFHFRQQWETNEPAHVPVTFEYHKEI